VILTVHPTPAGPPPERSSAAYPAAVAGPGDVADGDERECVRRAPRTSAGPGSTPAGPVTASRPGSEPDPAVPNYLPQPSGFTRPDRVMGHRGQMSSENAGSTSPGLPPAQAGTAASTRTVMMTKRVKSNKVDRGRYRRSTDLCARRPDERTVSGRTCRFTLTRMGGLPQTLSHRRPRRRCTYD